MGFYFGLHFHGFQNNQDIAFCTVKEWRTNRVRWSGLPFIVIEAEGETDWLEVLGMDDGRGTDRPEVFRQELGL